MSPTSLQAFCALRPVLGAQSASAMLAALHKCLAPGRGRHSDASSLDTAVECLCSLRALLAGLLAEPAKALLYPQVGFVGGLYCLQVRACTACACSALAGLLARRQATLSLLPSAPLCPGLVQLLLACVGLSAGLFRSTAPFHSTLHCSTSIQIDAAAAGLHGCACSRSQCSGLKCAGLSAPRLQLLLACVALLNLTAPLHCPAALNLTAPQFATAAAGLRGAAQFDCSTALPYCTQPDCSTICCSCCWPAWRCSTRAWCGWWSWPCTCCCRYGLVEGPAAARLLLIMLQGC